jgi:hypothetical protein
LSQSAFDSMDEARHNFVTLPTDQKKRRVVLKIKPRPGMTGVRLSVREIFIDPERPFDETTLPTQFFPVVTQHPRIPVANTKFYVQWKVVVHDIGASVDRKRGRLDTQSSVSGFFSSIESLYNPSLNPPPPPPPAAGGGTTPSVVPSS